jgi:predicted permease
MDGSRLSSRALVGAVLRRAAALSAGDWRHLFGLALIVFLPIGVIEGVFDRLADQDLTVTVAVVAVGVVASALVGEVFYSGAVAGLIAEPPEDGRPPTILELARRLPVWRLIAADVLVTLAVIVGLLVLVVPGVLVFVWFAFVAPSIEIEKRGLWDGLRRSRELVRGRFWIVLALVGGLEVATEAAVAGIEEVTHSIIGHGFGTEWVAQVVADVITNPPYAVVLVMLALELMREKPPAAAESA